MNGKPVFDTEVLFRPSSPELAFLPEGPQAAGVDHLSWVAIQHGPQARHGSLNVLNLKTRENTNYPLDGRPGFALPTTRPGVYLVGLERRLILFDIASGREQLLADEIETGVEGTIINDGEAFAEGVVFGTKDLKFAEQKAGLYFYRRQDHQLFKLSGEMTCSNGKILMRHADSYALLDICSHRKTVIAYRLDTERGRIEEVETVVDLRSEPIFPDGMVATPDRKSVIIAIYNPEAAEYGEARQYGLASGELEAVWRCPGSPQVTCPCLVIQEGRVKLVLTTAVEHMSAERQAGAPNAGCLFLGETNFSSLEDPVRFSV